MSTCQVKEENISGLIFLIFLNTISELRAEGKRVVSAITVINKKIIEPFHDHL